VDVRDRRYAHALLLASQMEEVRLSTGFMRRIIDCAVATRTRSAI
jgi:hypothetical protein